MFPLFRVELEESQCGDDREGAETKMEQILSNLFQVMDLSLILCWLDIVFMPE